MYVNAFYISALDSKFLLHQGCGNTYPLKSPFCFDSNGQFYQRSQTFNSSDTTEKKKQSAFKFRAAVNNYPVEIGWDILSTGSNWIHDWENEGLREWRRNSQVRGRLLSSDTRGDDTHLSARRKGCAQSRRLSGITKRTYPLRASRVCSHSPASCSESCGVAIKWLTKTVWNNLSGVFAPAGFFFFFSTAAIDSEQCRGHIKRIKYWPKWMRSQLESQWDTDISGIHFAETARSTKLVPSSERWGEKLKESKNINQRVFDDSVRTWLTFSDGRKTRSLPSQTGAVVQDRHDGGKCVWSTSNMTDCVGLLGGSASFLHL